MVPYLQRFPQLLPLGTFRRIEALYLEIWMSLKQLYESLAYHASGAKDRHLDLAHSFPPKYSFPSFIIRSKVSLSAFSAAARTSSMPSEECQRLGIVGFIFCIS